MAVTDTKSSINFKDHNNERKREMFIEDYNLQVNSEYNGYNKIAFKEGMSTIQSRKSIPAKPELLMKSKLRDTQNSAIRIVKR